MRPAVFLLGIDNYFFYKTSEKGIQSGQEYIDIWKKEVHSIAWLVNIKLVMTVDNSLYLKDITVTDKE